MKITVFTPTYNRAYIISNLYFSLRRQSFKDFEWLIVDDGSTDNTEILIRLWQKEEKSFPIRYFKQENGGKCRAINYGLDFAEGLLFVNIDSDDYLTDDALEKINLWENQLPYDEKYCGVSGNLGTGKNVTPNNSIDGEYFDGSLLDRYGRIDGERAFAFYTKVHRKYRYPEFPGENFMTEAVTWNRMAHDGYKMRFFNDIVCIYEYKDDGLTKAGSRLFLDNPHGYGLFLREKAEFIHQSKIQKQRMIYTFTCDLSHKYFPKLIAECIQAPLFLVWFYYIVHQVIHNIKKRLIL